MNGKSKLIAIVFLFAIVAISGCNGDKNGPTTTPTTTVKQVTTTTVSEVPGDGDTTTTTIPELTGVREKVIVDTAWVKANIDSIVPVYAGHHDKGQAEYAIGHISSPLGAVFLNCGEYCYTTTKANPGNVVDQAKWEKYLGEIGISNDDKILIYAKLDTDTWAGAYAGRAWWVLKYYGHENVYYLDGGLDTWDGELKASFEEQPRPATTYKATPNPDLIATADYVSEHINDPNVAIVSTRPVPGWSPLDEVNKQKKIPGDITIDWVEHHADDSQYNKFKSREEIERIYTSKGVTKDKEVITYCETGTRAANTLMVLYDLGYNVKDYAGSMSEWRELNSQNPEKYPVG